MTELVPVPSWEKLPAETDADYAHFTRWLELGTQRTVHRVALRQGASKDLIKRLHQEHDWELRSKDYDATLAEVVREWHVDDAQALALQGQLGEHLLKLGISAMEAKHPQMLNVKQATELIKLSAELIHRASGAADVRVSVETKQGVEDLVGRLLGQKND